MKQLIRTFLASILLVFLLFACGEEEVKPVVDYRCKVTSTSTLEKIYANNPVPIQLKIEKNNSEVGNYNFSYTIIEGSGDLIINGQTLAEGEALPIKLESFTPSFVPTSLGKHRLKFKFANEEYITESMYFITASELVFEARPENLPKKLLIDKPFAFDLNLSQKIDEGTISEFNAKIQILKGKGFVSFFGANDTILIPMATRGEDSLQRAAPSQYKVRLGNNKLHYKSTEPGENVLLLQVENEFGYEQDLNVPLNIELPDFKAITTADSIMSVGTINNFLLNIEDTDNFGANIYNVSYRNIKNSGKLKINGNEILVGATLQLQKGDNVCEFVPAALGAASLEFIVKDKYNSTRKDTVQFLSERSYVNVEVSNYDSLATIFDSRDISFSVNKTNYTGKYYIDIAQEPNGIASIKINGVDYAGGKMLIANSHNTLVTFVPKTIGDIKLNLKVYDDFGSETINSLAFKVSNSEGKIAISNHTPAINIFSPTSFNFSINKPKYTGKFQFEILQFSTEQVVPKGFGTLNINNVRYPGGRIDVANSNNTTVTFTAEETGEMILRLNVYDDFGGVISEDLPYNINNTDIKLTPQNLDKELLLMKEEVFTITPSKPFYDDKKLTLSITTIPANAGTLKVNGQSYISGGIEVVANNVALPISFTPAKEGTSELIIKAFDEWGASVKYPITFNVTNPPIQIQHFDFVTETVINTEKVFSFSVSKNNYSEGFKYSIVTKPADAGTFLVDDAAYPGGLTTLVNPKSTKLSFIPAVAEDIKMTLTVTDLYGGTVSRDYVYKVTNPKLNLSLTNVEDDLRLNTRSTFSFGVQKQSYTGKYYFEIAGENCSDVKINNVNYTLGERKEVSNALGTSVSFVPTKVGRDTIKLALSVYDDWGGVVNQKLTFSVTNSDIDLQVKNRESALFVGRPSAFTITAAKPNYTGNLKYEIRVTPADMGTLKVADKDYISGQGEITAGKELPVVFTPHKEGTASLKVIITDDWSGEKSESFNYTITTTPIQMEFEGYRSEATLNAASVFTMSLSKLYYTGGYNYSITTDPASVGTIKVNDVEYTGGKFPIADPANTKITYTPSEAGEVALSINVTDNIGGKQTKTLAFKVADNPIDLIVNNQSVGLMLHAETGFNFAVAKKGYKGKFQFEITTDPTNVGTFKVNGKAYTGGRMDVENTTNTLVNFTPSVLGDLKMSVRVYDEFGGERTQELPFSVKNSELKIVVSNQKHEIVYNTATTFNFGVLKPNYSGAYQYEITQSPANAGTLKVNGTAYTDGKAILTAPALSTVEYISTKAGQNILTLKVYDELEGTTQENIIFTCTNPEVNLAVTNHNAALVYKKATSFNVAMTKQGYTGTYQYEVTQEPAAGGTLTIDGKPYSGGIATVANPNNLLVGFTPTKEGYLSLRVRVIDETKQEVSKFVAFNVTNPPVQLSINAPTDKNVFVGKPVSFTVKADKTGYTGDFTYEITPMPVDCGDVTFNGKTNLVGVLNPNPGTVTFTPTKLGTTIFNVKVSDADGKSTVKQVDFNVTNTPVNIAFVNSETSIILKSPHSFVFKATKENYPDASNITYTVAPAHTGTLIVDGKAYTGTSISIPYGRLKNGINVQYTPDREGTRELSFSAKDDFNGFATKVISFNVTNPELSLYLTGINTGAANDATLGSTYKFYYNVSKANYNDDFSYWLTLDPSAVGIVGTSDVTPRGRSGIQMETGTITNNPNGVATGEIRFTPTNADYLNRDVKVKIIIRDKWNNEKTAEATFRIVTSAIAINVTRNTSIPVEEPYNFFFTVAKPGYTGGFKYSIVGWGDGDKLELSPDNTNWVTYSGGKFDLPHADHTYVRYTPKNIGTVPLKLFIYDNINGEAMQELTFDVKAPVVSLSADASTKQGYVQEFIPFNLTAKDGKNESMNVAFSLENPAFTGELKFNNTLVSAGSSRARSASSTSVASGTTNKLEINSFKMGSWGVTTTATNRWKVSASVTTSVQVEEKPKYSLTTSTTGQGEIDRSMAQPQDGYELNSTLTLTANPAEGWKFVRWSGDASGTGTSIVVTMNSHKNISAIFEEDARYTLTITKVGEGTVTVNPNLPYYKAGQNVTLTATPAEGWGFVGWEGVSGMAATTITIDGDKVVKAIFEKTVKANIRFNVVAMGGGTGQASINGWASIYLTYSGSSTPDLILDIGSGIHEGNLNLTLLEGRNYDVYFDVEISSHDVIFEHARIEFGATSERMNINSHDWRTSKRICTVKGSDLATDKGSKLFRVDIVTRQP